MLAKIHLQDDFLSRMAMNQIRRRIRIQILGHHIPRTTPWSRPSLARLARMLARGAAVRVVYLGGIALAGKRHTRQFGQSRTEL